MILALQCCPHDSAQALELTRLLCDIEPAPRRDEFAICARRDTSQDHIKAMADIAVTRFATVHVVMGQRAGVGWPEGPNDLWAETMMRLSLLRKTEKTRFDAALTFEADCVPLRADWIDVLNAAWKVANELGKHVVGHAENEPPDHINGNAIFRLGLLRKFPQLNGAHKRKGWDHFHGELLMGVGLDADCILQNYAMQDYDREYLEAVRKHAVVPALFHGTKGMTGIRIVRDMLVDGTLAQRSRGPEGEMRERKYVRHERPAPAVADPETTSEFSGTTTL